MFAYSLFEILVERSKRLNISYPVFSKEGEFIENIEKHRKTEEEVYILKKSFSERDGSDITSTATLYFFKKEGVKIEICLDYQTSKSSIEDYSFPQKIKDYIYKMFF